jgi:hypothetical protein
LLGALNRRRLLAGTAALASPLAAVPALADPSAPDPVHVSIARHRRAEADFKAANDAREALAKALPAGADCDPKVTVRTTMAYGNLGLFAVHTHSAIECSLPPQERAAAHEALGAEEARIAQLRKRRVSTRPSRDGKQLTRPPRKLGRP